jgi:hypothetical protein
MSGPYAQRTLDEGLAALTAGRPLDAVERSVVCGPRERRLRLRSLSYYASRRPLL